MPPAQPPGRTFHLLAAADLTPDPRTADGPAVIAPDGARTNLTPALWDAVNHLLTIAQAGQAACIQPFPYSLPLITGGDIGRYRVGELQQFADRGILPTHNDDGIIMIQLTDVLRLQAEHQQRQVAYLQSPIDPAEWDD